MTDQRDVAEEILAYLAGEIDRPTFADLDPDVRAAALRELALLEEFVDTDINMIPSFDEDPVAVRLGFRAGPEEARIYGPAVRFAREAAGLTKREVAKAVSASGRTVDEGWVSSIEDGTWRTISADIASLLADAFGVPARTLGNPATPNEGAMDEIALAVVGEHEQLAVTRFEEPFAEQFPRRLLGSFLDLQILFILCDNHEERVEAVDFAARWIVDAARFAAILVVHSDEELTTYVVKPEIVLSRFTAPAGAHKDATPSPEIVPTTLPLAIGEIVEGQVIRWPAFDRDLRDGMSADVTDLRAKASAEALKRFRTSASRVADDRKEAFASIGERELVKANALIDAILAGRDEQFDAARGLDDVERVS